MQRVRVSKRMQATHQGRPASSGQNMMKGSTSVPGTDALTTPIQVACNHGAATSLPQRSCRDAYVQDMVTPISRQQLASSPVPTLTPPEGSNAFKNANFAALSSWISTGCTIRSPYVHGSPSCPPVCYCRAHCK
jgi:hypothetical protein